MCRMSPSSSVTPERPSKESLKHQRISNINKNNKTAILKGDLFHYYVAAASFEKHRTQSARSLHTITADLDVLHRV